jgi:hypothetical protein
MYICLMHLWLWYGTNMEVERCETLKQECLPQTTTSLRKPRRVHQGGEYVKHAFMSRFAPNADSSDLL